MPRKPRRTLPKGITVDGRNGNYIVRYAEPDGERASRSFKTLDEAEQFQRQVETDRYRGTYVSPKLGKITMDEAERLYRPSRVNHSRNTKYRDETMYAKRVAPILGGRPLGQLTRAELQAFVNLHVAEGLAPNTVHKIWQLASRNIRQAIEDRLLPFDPCVGVKLPKVNTSIATKFVPTQAQVDAVVERMEPVYRTPVLLAAYTGMRWGEIAGLRWQHVNMLRRRVTIAEQMTETAGQLYVGDPTKTRAAVRQVTFPRFMADMLAEQKVLWGDDSGDDLVFVGPEGAPLRRNFVARVLHPACDAAGVPRFDFHTLRHACASWLFDAGAKTLEVKEMLGHSRASITTDIYAHLIDKIDTDDLSDRLERGRRAQ